MRQIDEDIKKREFKSVYLLYGPENYLKIYYRDRITELILNGDTMNYAKIDGQHFDMSELISQATTMPFFTEKRVVVVNGCGLFAKSADDLADFIPQIPETACVIFVEDDVKKVTRSYKAVEKNGCVEELTAITGEKELFKWLAPRLKIGDKELSIKESGWKAFVKRGNKDVFHMVNEMEKLVAYCADKGVIEAADVEEICDGYLQDKVFDMIDAIAKKDGKTAMRLYRDLLLLKEPPVKILVLMQKQFRMLYMIKQMSAQRVADSDIAKKASIQNFLVPKNRHLANSFENDVLIDYMDRATKAEEDIKTGRLVDTLAFEVLMNELIVK